MSEAALSIDHFSRFALLPKFTLDEAELVARYYALQRQQHPDRFVTATAERQLAAVQQTAALNQAFHTLKDPLRRAEYLLTLQGVDLQDEQQRGADADFLMQQLAWREAVSVAKDAAALCSLRTHIDHVTQERYQQLQQTLEITAWEAAAHCLNQLKFLVKLQQQILQLERAQATR